MSPGQLFCNDNLDEFSESIARLINDQSDVSLPVPGYQEAHPSWQYGYGDCTRSIYKQLPGYVGNERLVWPELRGAQLEDVVVGDLKKRIKKNREAIEQGLRELRALQYEESDE